MKATIYFTYQLGLDYSYSYKDSVHCNYINSIEIDSTINKEISIHFDKPDEFKFLSNAGGTGYTANKFYLIVQRVYDYEELSSDKWLKYDVTDQISGNTVEVLTANNLYSTNFKINLVNYNTDYANAVTGGTIPATIYNLNYIYYPTSESEFSFGDEEYFIGNVESDIEATIYAMNISIPTTDFGETNNLTYNGGDVYITEVGIYDDNKNLVGIAKLNNPIKAKDNNTLVFGLDF